MAATLTRSETALLESCPLLSGSGPVSVLVPVQTPPSGETEGPPTDHQNGNSFATNCSQS